MCVCVRACEHTLFILITLAPSSCTSFMDIEKKQEVKQIVSSLGTVLSLKVIRELIENLRFTYERFPFPKPRKGDALKTLTG